MSTVSRGFLGRRRESSGQLPPGQYLTNDFPVLSAGPTHRIPLDAWRSPSPLNWARAISGVGLSS
jgi:hypothetical protein